jgi:hypothetical protein
MNWQLLNAVHQAFDLFWPISIHPYIHIHPYTFHIYILYIYHFCCEHTISAVWIHRLTTACWGEHRLDGVEDALDQWLGVLNPWGQITWRENRLWGSGLCGGQKLHGDWLKSLKVGPMSNFWAHFFLEKSASIGRFLIFFRRWRSLNGSKRRIWAAGWKLARNYKNQFWTSQSDDISENIQIGEIYLLY